MAKKNFVLDTNVILHDPKSIYNFQDNDIYIPITVLEELDTFKKGSEQINYNARVFAREMDRVASGALLTNGVKIGDQGAKLFVLTSGLSHEKVRQVFMGNTSDHRILSATLTLAESQPGERTVLVTKDVNLRIKALALGVASEDYTSDKVQETEVVEGTQKEVEGVNADLIDRLYRDKSEGISVEEFGFAFEPVAQQCLVLRSERSTALARVDAAVQTVHLVQKQTLSGITPRNAEQTFAFDVLMDPTVSLVALTGTAGTGKTLLALAAALSQADQYRQIYLARPIVALSNKDLGFLPGDYKQKVQPYMQPLFDNFNVIKAQVEKNSAQLKEYEDMLSSEKLVIEALAYIRGRSLSNVICIVDEAQNLTPQEIKTIITRVGENAKIVFTGDVQQIDSPYLDKSSNGLTYMIHRMRGQEFFAHVNLIQGERSHLSDVAARLL